MNKQQNEPRRVDHHSNRTSLKVINSIISLPLKVGKWIKGMGVYYKKECFSKNVFWWLRPTRGRVNIHKNVCIIFCLEITHIVIWQRLKSLTLLSEPVSFHWLDAHWQPPPWLFGTSCYNQSCITRLPLHTT